MYLSCEPKAHDEAKTDWNGRPIEPVGRFDTNVAILEVLKPEDKGEILLKRCAVRNTLL